MSKLKKQIMMLLFVLLVVLIIINIWYFLAREHEASFYPTSYATLYYPLDIPTIRSWKKINQRELQLFINWKKSVDQWRILTDGQNPQIADGMNPIFKIANDEMTFHTYTFIPLPEGTGPSAEVTLRFYSKEFYAERGMKHHDVYIIKSSVPCGEFQQYPVKYWVDEYNYVGETELAKVDQLLCNEIGISTAMPTFEKMERLTRFLRKKLVNARGVPKNDFRWMNPWLIYKEMAAGTGKGWCTQHGQIWTFFANRAGIPTRLMQGARTQDNDFVYTGHTWSESYIKEQHRWAFVDLSHSHIYVTNKQGQVLNTAELFFINQVDGFDSTFARIFRDWEWKDLANESNSDSIVTVPFAQCNKVVKNEFSSHAIFKIRRPPNVEDIRTIYSDLLKDATYCWGNLERYLFKPPLAYSFYPTNGKRTYVIRWLLFFSMILVLVVLVLLVSINYFRNK
jgi:hypothetical protein